MSNGISADNNDLYTNSQMHMHENSSHSYANNHPQHHIYNQSMNTQQHSNSTVPPVSNAKVTKPRKKRKPNEPGTSFEEEAPTKARKRKSK